MDSSSTAMRGKVKYMDINVERWVYLMVETCSNSFCDCFNFLSQVESEIIS